MKTGWMYVICRMAFLVLVLQALSCRQHSAPPSRTGLALSIIYDTSGSMADSVINASGEKEPKFLIAQRVLNAILDQLTAYINDTAPGTTREVQAELLILESYRARAVLKMGSYRAESFKTWIDSFSKPGGGTPLGRALRTASEDLLTSPLSRKHILVLTDGENTEGPAPESVLPEILANSLQLGVGIQVHFVAFGVAADVFNLVKKLGATVVGANDEIQLKDQLELILQKKILLENEELPLK